MTTQRLAGRTALITGSTSGLGAGIAVAFAREGASVVVSGRGAERGVAIVEQITAAGGTATFVHADLALDTARSAADLARAATAALGGRVDILVNNAGIFPHEPTAEMSMETFESSLAQITASAPAGRTGVPQDVAAAAV